MRTALRAGGRIVILAPALLAAAVASSAALRRAPAPKAPAADYSVEAGEGARELRIEAAFAEPPAGGLVFDEGEGRYARAAEVERRGRWSPAAVEGDTLSTLSCRQGPCHVRYRFALEDAARGGGRRNMAASAQAGSVLAPPSTWLVRPARRGEGRYRLRVTTPPGVSFATGIVPAGPATYEADLADLPEAPYSVFGSFETLSLRAAGSQVEVALLRGEVAAGRGAVLSWVEEAAADVAGYYGRFPVPRVLVIVVPGGRRAVGYGTTMGNGGASIMVWLGSAARTEDLRHDWVLTHEMVHLGLPNLPRGKSWMEEGLATYVEPIARARRGRLSAEEVWSDLVRRTPAALPGPGGLDASRGFAAVYWGGALFWLLSDVEIRERTGGRRSLEDALGGVRDAGGSIAVSWPVERVLRVADAATGVEVLRPLYERMARSADAVDLAGLWSRLGVEDQGTIRFRDDAPLAAVRRAITAAGVPSAAPAGPPPIPPP